MFRCFARLTLIVSILNGCGSKEKESDHSQPGPRPNADVIASPYRHTVLIIDDGFDLNHSVFTNKIVARYRLRCEQSELFTIDAPTDFELQKTKLISYLASDNNDCTISENLSFEASRELESIQTKRDEWNKAVRTKSISQVYEGREHEADEIFSIISDNGRYHGTNTAGLIAFENSNINLVILQVELSSSQSIGKNKLTQSEYCPSQTAVDLTAKLFNDPEVIEAYIAAPLASISGQDAAINQLVEQHNVKFINKSYGMLPRLSIQRRLDTLGCNVDIDNLYSARANLVRARRQRLPAESEKALIFQAAGNEGLPIQTIEDSWDCTASDDSTILVGGIDHEYAATPWTNHGNCVEMYAVGDRIITPGPLNFYSISSGTSLSAPLALRYATLTATIQEPIEDIKARLLDSLNTRKQLPEDHFSEDLIYFTSDSVASYGYAKKSKYLAKPRPASIDKRGIPKLLRHLF